MAILNILVRETADLWFHTLVMLAHQGLGGEAVLNELQRRFGFPVWLKRPPALPVDSFFAGPVI